MASHSSAEKALEFPPFSSASQPHALCAAGRVEDVKILLNYYAQPPEEQDNDGRTLIHHAVAFNQIEILDLLFEKCTAAVINLQDNYGNTALYYAVHQDDLSFSKIIISLVRHGASPDIPNKLHRTPRQLLYSNGSVLQTCLDISRVITPDAALAATGAKPTISLTSSAVLSAARNANNRATGGFVSKARIAQAAKADECLRDARTVFHLLRHHGPNVALPGTATAAAPVPATGSGSGTGIGGAGAGASNHLSIRVSSVEAPAAPLTPSASTSPSPTSSPPRRPSFLGRSSRRASAGGLSPSPSSSPSPSLSAMPSPSPSLSLPLPASSLPGLPLPSLASSLLPPASTSTSSFSSCLPTPSLPTAASASTSTPLPSRPSGVLTITLESDSREDLAPSLPNTNTTTDTTHGNAHPPAHTHLQAHTHTQTHMQAQTYGSQSSPLPSSPHLHPYSYPYTTNTGFTPFSFAFAAPPPPSLSAAAASAIMRDVQRQTRSPSRPSPSRSGSPARTRARTSMSPLRIHAASASTNNDNNGNSTGTGGGRGGGGVGVGAQYAATPTPVFTRRSPLAIPFPSLHADTDTHSPHTATTANIAGESQPLLRPIAAAPIVLPDADAPSPRGIIHPLTSPRASLSSPRPSLTSPRSRAYATVYGSSYSSAASSRHAPSTPSPHLSSSSPSRKDPAHPHAHPRNTAAADADATHVPPAPVGAAPPTNGAVAVLSVASLMGVVSAIEDTVASHDDCELLLAQVDVGMDGRVDLEDFWSSLLPRAGCLSGLPAAGLSATVDPVFDFLDVDGDGVIGVADIMAVKQRLGGVLYVDNEVEARRLIDCISSLYYLHKSEVVSSLTAYDGGAAYVQWLSSIDARDKQRRQEKEAKMKKQSKKNEGLKKTRHAMPNGSGGGKSSSHNRSNGRRSDDNNNYNHVDDNDDHASPTPALSSAPSLFAATDTYASAVRVSGGITRDMLMCVASGLLDVAVTARQRQAVRDGQQREREARNALSRPVSAVELRKNGSMPRLPNSGSGVRPSRLPSSHSLSTTSSDASIHDLSRQSSTQMLPSGSQSGFPQPGFSGHASARSLSSRRPATSHTRTNSISENFTLRPSSSIVGKGSSRCSSASVIPGTATGTSRSSSASTLQPSRSLTASQHLARRDSTCLPSPPMGLISRRSSQVLSHTHSQEGELLERASMHSQSLLSPMLTPVLAPTPEGDGGMGTGVGAGTTWSSVSPIPRSEGGRDDVDMDGCEYGYMWGDVDAQRIEEETHRHAAMQRAIGHTPEGQMYHHHPIGARTSVVVSRVSTANGRR